MKFSKNGCHVLSFGGHSLFSIGCPNPPKFGGIWSNLSEVLSLFTFYGGNQPISLEITASPRHRIKFPTNFQGLMVRQSALVGWSNTWPTAPRNQILEDQTLQGQPKNQFFGPFSPPEWVGYEALICGQFSVTPLQSGFRIGVWSTPTWPDISRWLGYLDFLCHLKAEFGRVAWTINLTWWKI